MGFSRRDALGVVSSSIVAAVAGCTDGEGDPSSSDSLSEDDIDYPDGYNEQIDDWEAARQSHREALGKQSYRVDKTGESMDYGANSITIKVEPADEETLRVREKKETDYETTWDSTFTRYRYFADKEYIKTVEDGEERFNVDENNSYMESRDHVEWRYLQVFDFALSDYSESGDTVVLQYTADSLTEEGEDEMKEEFDGPSSGSLSVRSDGRIKSYQLQLGEVGVDDIFLTTSVEISQVGEASVDEPNWIDKAASSR